MTSRWHCQQDASVSAGRRVRLWPTAPHPRECEVSTHSRVRRELASEPQSRVGALHPPLRGFPSRQHPTPGPAPPQGPARPPPSEACGPQESPRSDIPGSPCSAPLPLHSPLNPPRAKAPPSPGRAWPWSPGLMPSEATCCPLSGSGKWSPCNEDRKLITPGAANEACDQPGVAQVTFASTERRAESELRTGG